MSGPAPIETVIAAASPGSDRAARSIHVNFHVRVPAPHRGGTLSRAAGSLPPPILAAENDIRVDFRKKTNLNVIVEANYIQVGFLTEINPKDRKSTRLNSSHVAISYAVFCSKKKHSRPRSTDSADD